MNNKIKVSFLMPAKNAALYIGEAIQSAIAQVEDSWELIIVDDHSDDNTCALAKEAAIMDKRIKLFTSKGKGQAAALNTAYLHSSGQCIKFFDADDLLHKNLILYCDAKEVFYHKAFTTDSNMNIIGATKANFDYINKNFKFCLANLISIPRCLGIFPRRIADKIFPIIEDYDCADYWIALIVKKYATNIVYLKEPLYYYRQHSMQTYGGIYNFKKSKVFFRAKRKMKFALSVEENFHLTGYFREEVAVLLRPKKSYFSLLGKEHLTIKDICRSQLSYKQKTKIYFMRNFSIFLSAIKLVIGKISRYKAI